MARHGNMKSLEMAEKRVFDALLAILVFVCALPLFVVIPLLIKLTTPGPVFYKAPRLGRNGRPFFIWKFRSMYSDADRRLESLLMIDESAREEYKVLFKIKNDPRITFLGKILRRTSLDELPQLLNVFRGEMSLVGPRPIVEAEISRYGKDYEIVSKFRPGITGLWQTSGRNDVDYNRRIALDTYYVLNWSHWLDVCIVLKTVWCVLCMKGAY